MNGEITRIPLLKASHQRVRKETEGWGDYKKLPEEISEAPQIRRMLLEADYVVHQTEGIQNHKRRMVNFCAAVYAVRGRG